MPLGSFLLPVRLMPFRRARACVGWRPPPDARIGRLHRIVAPETPPVRARPLSHFVRRWVVAPKEALDTHTRITVRLPAAVREQLEELAAESDRDLSGQVRFALRDYVAKSENGGGDHEK